MTNALPPFIEGYFRVFFIGAELEKIDKSWLTSTCEEYATSAFNIHDKNKFSGSLMLRFREFQNKPVLNIFRKLLNKEVDIFIVETKPVGIEKTNFTIDDIEDTFMFKSCKFLNLPAAAADTSKNKTTDVVMMTTDSSDVVFGNNFKLAVDLINELSYLK